ncbi:MAG: GNAT family N-acetyltransferase, partial [Lachnospiraceae bacterium]|nr:GNAT family N-acetyltransferase [Lachnospiraceae bacterium]
GEFEIDADRGDFDYIYTVEKLATLRGKKLHGKRNHIARFMDDQDWRYEPMSAENIEDCRKMSKEWERMRADKWNDSMEEEINVLDEALNHFDELGFVGGVLYKADEIVAFTIGERLNADTLVVHFEKAYPDLQGAYPMINQQFILHEGEQFTYVNREEDTGDLGLRKAKLSYYPDIILKKYRVVESSVVFANETDIDAIEEIWYACFGDDREYIDLYLSNRFETENMLVIHEDGRPVSMLSLLPVTITIDGESHAARYVYAVATLPAYRKKGYASKLIEHAFYKYEEPLILQPASEELRRYYEKLGFHDVFRQSPCWIYNAHAGKMTQVSENMAYEVSEDITHMSEIETEITTLGKWSAEPVTAKEYKEIRDLYFGGEGYVEWDENAIQYAIMENSFCGGGALKLTDGEERRVLMYRVCTKSDDLCGLQVVETTLEDNELKELLPELMRYTHTSQAYEKNQGGMILHTKETAQWDCDEGYLNLTLG